MKFIDYILLRAGIFLFFVVISLPLFVGLGLILYCSEELGRFRFLAYIAAVGIFVWVGGIGWMSNRVAGRMAFENERFGRALRLAWFDAKLHLAFLPLVGRLFGRKRDEDDDEGTT